ncbi:helix-turn-helix domain-containing protein [Kordiimonas gwangyangensis]|uniref:helix-turn-helix domain-containing protein n=1 Tax=Kordiimonas gwangyangensis TaxID=288022 RepID=UPI00036CF775|nr:helix-turn-helix transcriptional regulator [Kordiimonas gwangyangensis]
MSRIKTLRSPAQMELQKLLKAARVQAGLSQLSVAEGMGWRQADISKVEAGERRLDVVEFVRMARVVGFNPDKILRMIDAVLD